MSFHDEMEPTETVEPKRNTQSLLELMKETSTIAANTLVALFEQEGVFLGELFNAHSFRENHRITSHVSGNGRQSRQNRSVPVQHWIVLGFLEHEVPESNSTKGRRSQSCVRKIQCQAD
jgi:hypothetical protein